MAIQILSDMTPIRQFGVKNVFPFINRIAKLVGGGRMPPKSLDELAIRLKDFTDSLQQVSSEVESEFLHLGEELQTVYADATDLAQCTLETVKRIGGETDAGALYNIDKLVRKSLAQLRTCHEQVTADLNRFFDGSGYLGDLCNICPMIEKMALMLKVVGLNIGVESSRSAVAREMFGVVATEVRELSEQIAKLAANIRDDAQGASHQQRVIHREISGSLDQLGKVANDAEQTVQEAVSKIKILMTRSLETMDRAGAHSNEISRQVGEVVVGIQFHDSMNQRIAHINKALKEVETTCFKVNSKKMPKADKRIKLKDAQAIINLQAAQLREVISEIHDVYSQNARAFDAIINRVGRLAEDLAMFGGDDDYKQTYYEASADAGASAVSHDIFFALKDALTRFHGLLDQGYHLHHRMTGTFTEASEAASRLSGYTEKVHRSNFNIHIIALNSIIKAAHMGAKGRTLETLAQAVKDLSDQSDNFVADVNTILDMIGTTIHLNRDDSKGEEEADADMSANVMDDSIEQISHAYEQFRANSLKAAERSDALKQDMAQTRAGLDFLKNLADRLSKHLTELEAIGNLLCPWVNRANGDSAVSARHIATRYTMKQERIIHAEQIADDSSGNNRDKDASEPTDTITIPLTGADLIKQDNDAGNDIEFFSADEIAIAPGDEIEIVPDLEPDEETVKDKDGSDLGDNVELF